MYTDFFFFKSFCIVSCNYSECIIKTVAIKQKHNTLTIELHLLNLTKIKT